MARTKKEAVAAENIDESPAIEVVEEPKAEVAAVPEVKSAEDGVAELKKRLEASEEDKRRLERERNEAVSRAYAAKNETNDTNARLFDSAQAQLVENNKYLKSQYALALQNQDFAAAADLQEAMALNQAKVLQIENGKQALKETPREQSPLDPVEAFISNAKLGSRPAAWIRAHPEYATNPRLTQKMIAADNVADGDGFERGTDEYFARVEEILKINRPAPPPAIDDDWRGDQFSDAAAPTSGRQMAPSAIPVSRSTSPSGQRSGVVRLSAAEAEAADLSGMSHAEYYKQKMAIRSERLN